MFPSPREGTSILYRSSSWGKGRRCFASWIASRRSELGLLICDTSQSFSHRRTLEAFRRMLRWILRSLPRTTQSSRARHIAADGMLRA